MNKNNNNNNNTATVVISVFSNDLIVFNIATYFCPDQLWDFMSEFSPDDRFMQLLELRDFLETYLNDDLPSGCALHTSIYRRKDGTYPPMPEDDALALRRYLMQERFDRYTVFGG